MCTVKSFVLLVKEMRDNQKEYFRTRDYHLLTKSKALESKVDSIIAATSEASMDRIDEAFKMFVKSERAI